MVAAIPDLTELELPLSRDAIHLFVAGPGKGEACVLVLPDGTWIFVDSCCVRKSGAKQVVPQVLFENYGASFSRAWCLLTHPHLDHYQGLNDLVDATAPEAVYVTGPDPEKNLVNEARQVPPSHATDAIQKQRSLFTVLEHLHQWTENRPGVLRSTSSPMTFDGTGEVEIFVRAPSQDVLVKWWADGTLPRVLRDDANLLSTVLDIRWQGARILLGGDLPCDGDTGWTRMLSSNPELASPLPNVFKISHHGSIGALHSDILQPTAHRITWLVTPYSPVALPKREGLEFLLGRNQPLHITAPSMRRSAQIGTNDPTIDVETLLARTEAARSRSPFYPTIAAQRPAVEPALESLDAIWHVAIGPEGQLLSQHRGRAALLVTRSS